MLPTRIYVPVMFFALLPIPASAAPECAPESIVPGSHLCLSGITVAGAERIATFKNDGATVSEAVGGMLDGWLVVAIDTAAVTISRATETTSLRLGSSLGGDAPHQARNVPAKELHNVSPSNAGKADRVGVSGKQDVFSISTHLPPVKDY